MLPSSARLSKSVTMSRIRGFVNTGCMGDQQLVAKTQEPPQDNKTEKQPPAPKQQEQPDDQHADADSAVWRDRISAKTKMAATPEARSLQSI